MKKEVLKISQQANYMKGSWADYGQSRFQISKLWTRQTVPQARTGMTLLSSPEQYINILQVFQLYNNN